jgi:integrase
VTPAETMAKKPHTDFPLHIHAAHVRGGRWAKKIGGKRVYFGKVADDPDGEAALLLWLEQKDDLLAGRKPRNKADVLTVVQLCNHFLAFKDALRTSGEIAERTYQRYFKTCEYLVKQLGRNRPVDDLAADDFQALRTAMASVWGPVALGNEIQYVRSVFRYGRQAGLLAADVQFGPAFKKPSAKVLRVERASSGTRLFEPKQIRALLKVASVNMRAMILLGINSGLGNSDMGAVTIGAFDLHRRWLTFPRPKTGIPRRIPLWPETVDAVRAAIGKRKSGLVFLTDDGGSYVPDGDSSWRVSDEFARTAKRAKVAGRQFYDLRRTFQTVADGSHDAVATSAIMGHVAASGDMASVYRQGIDDSRLRAVAAHVRAWLFTTGKTPRQ